MYPSNQNFNRFSGNGSRSSYTRSYPQTTQLKKRSGCKVTMVDGRPIVSGWKAQRNGMLSLYARPTTKSKTTTSKNGNTWINLFVTITNRQTMQVTKTSGLFNMNDKKLYIKEFNLIANPKAPRGGYFGVHLRSNYNR